jgi:hypothetical protein
MLKIININYKRARLYDPGGQFRVTGKLLKYP